MLLVEKNIHNASVEVHSSTNATYITHTHIYIYAIIFRMVMLTPLKKIARNDWCSIN